MSHLDRVADNETTMRASGSLRRRDVDEFHHAEAATYRKLLEHLQPKVLLGLTATPERTDGQDIVHWFDNRIACDMRLWQALDQGLLSPFHYFGVADGTDLRGVAFDRGRYASAASKASTPAITCEPGGSSKLLPNGSWIPHAAHLPSVPVRPAKFMADQFSLAGLPSVALDGSSPRDLGYLRFALVREAESIFTSTSSSRIDSQVDTIFSRRPRARPWSSGTRQDSLAEAQDH